MDKIKTWLSVLPHPIRWAFTMFIGAVLLILGLVMMVTPGPGLLFIFFGLSILALELEWARELNKQGLQGLQVIVAKFKDLDDKVMEFVHANSVTCLGKQYNKEVMKEALYKSPMAPGKGEYAPTLKLKMMTGANGDFTAEAYDSNRKLLKLTPESLEKGQGVVTIVEVNQIWFIDNKFGISVRLQQMLLAPTNKLKGFGFIDQPAVEAAPSDTADAEDEDELVEDDEDADV
jgi:uncharacterized protein (TIGR02611 family)